jgi:hypothetical protein
VHGDLTAECAAAVAAVLDALSAPAGKEGDRSKGQRYHDALQEAMRWLGKMHRYVGHTGTAVGDADTPARSEPVRTRAHRATSRDRHGQPNRHNTGIGQQHN